MKILIERGTEKVKNLKSDDKNVRERKAINEKNKVTNKYVFYYYSFSKLSFPFLQIINDIMNQIFYQLCKSPSFILEILFIREISRDEPYSGPLGYLTRDPKKSGVFIYNL